MAGTLPKRSLESKVFSFDFATFYGQSNAERHLLMRTSMEEIRVAQTLEQAKTIAEYALIRDTEATFGRQISSITSIAITPSGELTMVPQTARHEGMVAQAEFTGGVEGRTYEVVTSVLLINSETLQMVGHIAVVD